VVLKRPYLSGVDITLEKFELKEIIVTFHYLFFKYYLKVLELKDIRGILTFQLFTETPMKLLDPNFLQPRKKTRLSRESSGVLSDLRPFLHLNLGLDEKDCLKSIGC